MVATMWFTPVLLIAGLLLFAFAHHALRRKYPKDEASLVDAIDQLLPQTQCAQCGYPGCRPYAAAIVNGAALNLCPPGGTDVYHALNELMGAEIEQTPPLKPSPAVVTIDENECIGCTLCLPPCPVDAIVGAANKMHTVIASQCTGCELCIPACPVDCISVQPLASTFVQRPTTKPVTQGTVRGPARACVGCGMCNPACPVGLPAQELLYALQHQNLSAATTQGLADCIECGLCDRACPSDIALAGIFGTGKLQLRQEQDIETTRLRAKMRYEAHIARHKQQQSETEGKRTQRLQRSGRWS